MDDTLKLIEQMVYAKDTNALIQRRREDTKVFPSITLPQRSQQKLHIKSIKKFEGLIKQILTRTKHGRKQRTNVTTVVMNGIPTMEQNLDGKNIVQLKMQHVRIAKRWVISQRCQHVDPKLLHASR